MAQSTQAATTASAPASMPLFYSKPEPLNAERHGALSLAARQDFSFARSAHAIPVTATEMPAAMRSYPIVFIGAEKSPVIIVGLRRDESLFVDSNGKWSEPHYIPSYVRRYPFIMAHDAAQPGNGRLALCIDRGSDRVVDTVLAPLRDDKIVPFFEGTEASEATRHALTFCNQFQIDWAATQAMIARIDAHKLFAPRRSTITLPGGEVLNLTDFQVIDEQAFNALGDEAFLDLRKSGALGLIYCHLASSNSWTSLIHQASQRKAAGKA